MFPPSSRRAALAVAMALAVALIATPAAAPNTGNTRIMVYCDDLSGYYPVWNAPLPDVCGWNLKDSATNCTQLWGFYDPDTDTHVGVGICTYVPDCADPANPPDCSDQWVGVGVILYGVGVPGCEPGGGCYGATPIQWKWLVNKILGEEDDCAQPLVELPGDDISCAYVVGILSPQPQDATDFVWGYALA